MGLNFLSLHVDVLAPAINDDTDLAAGITKSLKDFQGPLGTANSRNVQRHHQQNVIGYIKCSNCHGIESMRQVENKAFISPAHQVKNFSHVLTRDVVSLVCFKRCCK